MMMMMVVMMMMLWYIYVHGRSSIVATRQLRLTAE